MFPLKAQELQLISESEFSAMCAKCLAMSEIQLEQTLVIMDCLEIKLLKF